MTLNLSLLCYPFVLHLRLKCHDLNIKQQDHIYHFCHLIVRKVVRVSSDCVCVGVSFWRIVSYHYVLSLQNHRRGDSGVQNLTHGSGNVFRDIGIRIHVFVLVVMQEMGHTSDLIRKAFRQCFT